MINISFKKYCFVLAEIIFNLDSVCLCMHWFGGFQFGFLFVRHMNMIDPKNLKDKIITVGFGRRRRATVEPDLYIDHRS
jgi:hypothetical protein